jgi:hypothetical protein
MVTEKKKTITHEEFVNRISKSNLSASEMDELFLDY